MSTLGRPFVLLVMRKADAIHEQGGDEASILGTIPEKQQVAFNIIIMVPVGSHQYLPVQ